MTGMWQLLWTTQRERDIRKSPPPFHSQEPSHLSNEYGIDRMLGQFHSQMMIDPINNKSHLELDDQRKSTFLGFISCLVLILTKGYAAGQTFSVTQFPLPPFIQDYGPGPNPEPDDEFDAVMRNIMREVDAGLWDKQ